MYDFTTTVAVGLDVHARSVRLAAVRADELLEERSLPYDEDAVERILRRWPGVRSGVNRRWPPGLKTHGGVLCCRRPRLSRTAPGTARHAHSRHFRRCRNTEPGRFRL